MAGRSFYPEAFDVQLFAARRANKRYHNNHVSRALLRFICVTRTTRQIDSGPFTNVGSDVRMGASRAHRNSSRREREREAIVSRRTNERILYSTPLAGNTKKNRGRTKGPALEGNVFTRTAFLGNRRYDSVILIAI